jgi:CheY-like chemotaxis protein
MPGMNGQVLANAAKARWPALRVLFITGYAEGSALALQSGDVLVQKPFRIAELAKQVADMLDRPVRGGGADNVVPIGRGR